MRICSEVIRQNPGQTGSAHWENRKGEGLKSGGAGEKGQEGRELQSEKRMSYFTAPL